MSEPEYTPEQQQVLDDMKEVMDDIYARVARSTKQYGMSYLLADTPHEVEEELLDMPGWMMMEAVRIRQVLRSRLPELRDQYLVKFLKNQKKEYLQYLQAQIVDELSKRP